MIFDSDDIEFGLEIVKWLVDEIGKDLGFDRTWMCRHCIGTFDDSSRELQLEFMRDYGDFSFGMLVF